jgi:hypothetical protein
VGKAIGARARSSDNAINDLAQVRALPGETPQRFRITRFWCVLTPSLLAFAVSVDAVRVFQELLTIN